MRYRRAFIPGGSFFFTLVTERRRPLLASADTVEVLRMAFRAVRSMRPFEVDAMVVLPDHLHCIWTLPPDDADFATRWRLVKTWFTKHCDPALRGASNRARKAKGEQALWQHRYWEHLLRDEADFVRHVEYIHYNPVVIWGSRAWGVNEPGGLPGYGYDGGKASGYAALTRPTVLAIAFVAALLGASATEAQVRLFSLAPADLIVDGATLSNVSPRPGETIQVRATIKNIGGLNLSGPIAVTASPSIPHRSPPQASTNNLNAGASRLVAPGYTVPSTARNGEQICFEVSVSSSAEDSSRRGNNTLDKDPCLTVQAAPALLPSVRLPSPGAQAPPAGQALDPGGLSLPGGKAALKIAAVKTDPKSASIFPPKGVLSLSSAVVNAGGTPAANTKLNVAVAKKPRSGSPTWKTPGEIGFKGPGSASLGEIEPGKSETTEVELSATSSTQPGTYLYRLQAVASAVPPAPSGTYQGEFRVGYVLVPMKMIEAMKKKGQDPKTLKFPPWALIQPSGQEDVPVAGEEDWGGWGDWGGDWGDWGGGDWGGDWGGADWGGGGATPGPTRTPGAVGEGPSKGMDLAELKSAGETPGPKFVPGRIVLFALPKGGETAEALLAAVAKRHALSEVEKTRLGSVGAAVGLYKIVGRREVMDVAGKIQQDGRVVAQPDFIFEALTADPKAPLQYGPPMLGIPRLKGRLTGKGVKVALLDTGVDAEHEDLAGRVADYRDMVNGKSKPTADLHGTAVAGIIAALAGNGKGGAGIAPGVSLVVVKVIEPESAGSLKGTSTTFHIARGLDSAVASGARVINLSLGGPQDAIVGGLVDAAIQKNIIVVAAAGNGGPQAAPPFPASHPGVIAVTAIDQKTKPYMAANQGDYISISAPGVEVFTTAPGNKYRLVSGTSFAAAHVSGVAALVLEARPGLSVNQVREALIAGSVDIGPKGKDPHTGHGRLNACKAIQAAAKREMCGR